MTSCFICIFFDTSVYAIESNNTPARLPNTELSNKKEEVTTQAYFQNVQGTIKGSFDLHYEHADPWEIDNITYGSDADLFLDTVDIDFSVCFYDWLSLQAVFNIEDIGKENESSKDRFDEASATLKKPQVPWYLTAGKTTFPFGVFADRLISGTHTEDLYEIQDKGVILGFAPKGSGMDFSFSYYSGQQIIKNLINFNVRDADPDFSNNNDLDSYVGNLTYNTPQKTFKISVFYNNEPGNDSHNQTIGCATSFTLWNVTFDTEYFAALEREKDEDDMEYKEKAWFVGLAYQVIEPFHLALRYEVFDDGHAGQQDEVLNYRYLGGFGLNIFEHITLSSEYRYSDFEKEFDTNAAKKQNELIIQLSLEYEWDF